MKLKKIKLPFPNRLAIVLISLIIGTSLGVVLTTVPLLANFTLPKLAFLASKISQYTPQQAVKLEASPSAQITAVSTSTPTPSSFPNSSSKPNITYSGPSQRALKLATFIYGHSSEEEKEDLRNKHGVKKSTYEQEITDHAYWFDKNPNVMAMNESIMQDIINASRNPPTQPSQVDTSEIERKIRQQQGDLEQLQSDMRFDCIMGGGVPSGGKCL